MKHPERPIDPPEGKWDYKLDKYIDSKQHEHDTGDILLEIAKRPENLETTQEYISEAIGVMGVAQIFGSRLEQADVIASIEEYVQSKYTEAAKNEAIKNYLIFLEDGGYDS